MKSHGNIQKRMVSIRYTYSPLLNKGKKEHVNGYATILRNECGKEYMITDLGYNFISRTSNGFGKSTRNLFGVNGVLTYITIDRIEPIA